MRIIARYITNEILLAFFGVTGILLLIVLSNRFAAYLAKVATGELPFTLVFYIVGLYIPELLSYLMPLGFFVALLFAFGRLYVDHEMTIFSACGISHQSLIRLTLGIAGMVMILTSILTLWLVPMMAGFRDKALSQGEVLGTLQSMLPQHFQTFGDGNLIFYLEQVDSKSDGLEGVFIAERPTDISNIEKGWAVMTAEKAEIKQNETDGHLYLILKDGHRYQGIPGAANYSTIDFQEYGRSIPVALESSKADSLRGQDTLALLSSIDPEDIAELQWRLSLPLTVPILALMAVPLAYVRPRQGRFAKFLPALAIYIIYYNLFTVCRRWVASSVLPSYLGVWWVHLAFLCIGLVLVAKETGWLRRKT